MDKDRMEKEGWKLATTTSGEHLNRTLEMYNELGFDVYTEEVTPGDCDECNVCYVVGDEVMYRIYTRIEDEAEDII